MNLIDQIESEQLRTDIPEFSAGDTVVVQVKVREGNRQRLQAFEGVVIAKKNRGLNSAFTVRKISHGEGVERVFQTHSSMIDSVTVKEAVKLGRLSSIICVVLLVRLQELKRSSVKNNQQSNLNASSSWHFFP